MEGDSNGNGGDFREEEALLLKALSETKYKSRDIASAIKYARLGLRVFPSLPGIEPLISSLRILRHVALSPLPQTQPDYYGILQMKPFSDVESVQRQYKSLALMLHPDKNPSFVCQDAFKAVGEALQVLSDSEEKERYDLGLRVRMQEEGLGKGGNVGLGSEGRFWSRCGVCGKLHDFEKGYAGKRLVCSGRGKTFKALGVGDGNDSESEETDEDPNIVAGTCGVKETSGGGDRVVKSGDIIYVRKRKGIANKFGESGAIRKRMDEDSNSGGRAVGAKKVKREEIRANDGYSKGLKGGSEMEMEEEEEGFWDLKLKDGLKKGKKVETSGDWWSKLMVSVKDDETKNDEKAVRSHVVSGLRVHSRNARRKVESGKKHNTRDMEEKKPMVVMGLRCITEEDRLKITKLSDKGSSDVNQSPKADMVGGSGEWGGSRRRSMRVLVKLAEKSALILVKKSNSSGEEMMTLAEMQSRLIQKMSDNRRTTSNQKKKMEKEKEREEAEVNLADGGDESEDKRVVEQIGEDGEEELRNNENEAVKENEFEEEEEEPERMREEEEKASGMDEERKIEKTSVKEDDDDEQQDQKNVNKDDKKEMEVVLVARERSEDEKGKVEDQTDMTGNVPIHMHGTTERGTWGNGDEVEETTTDTRWAKRIRCYETKRRGLLKRSMDSGVEILKTPGPPDYQSGLAIVEQPIVTKSRSVRHTVSSNSDFYNFDKDRGERNFKMGQVWAVYDEFGLPRRYGLIEEVVSINPFAVHLKWLTKQDMKGQDLTAPCSACGRFKVTTSTTVQSVGIFSHEVDGDKVGRETYDIYPRKDSVWAIRNERYDIAVCLTSYIDMFGLSLAYVEKVEGFKTVYKRKEFGWHAVRWLGKDEVFLLSHQVPARRLSHEDGSNFEEDCWVLDPASIPSSPLV